MSAIVIKKCPIDGTNPFDSQTRGDSLQFNKLYWAYWSNKIMSVKIDGTCTAGVEDNKQIIRSDRGCPFRIIAVQHEEHSAKFLGLSEWKNLSSWVIVRRCQDRDVMLGKVS